MHAAASTSVLDARLAELVMSALCPCDLGDGIEVVHDVESVEVEMECDVDDAADDAPAATEPADDSAMTLRFALGDELATTTQFAREASADEVGTHQFVRYSAPYERIEIELDPRGFVRATIEDAQRLAREPLRDRLNVP